MRFKKILLSLVALGMVILPNSTVFAEQNNNINTNENKIVSYKPFKGLSASELNNMPKTSDNVANPTEDNNQKKAVTSLPYNFSFNFNTSIQSRYSFTNVSSLSITTNTTPSGYPTSDRFNVNLCKETWWGDVGAGSTWNYNHGTDKCTFSGLSRSEKYFFYFSKANDGAWLKGTGVVR